MLPFLASVEEANDGVDVRPGPVSRGEKEEGAEGIGGGKSPFGIFDERESGDDGRCVFDDIGGERLGGTRDDGGGPNRVGE